MDYIDPRSVFESTIRQLKNANVQQDAITAVEQQRARDKRTHRVGILLYRLMLLSESGRDCTYTDVASLAMVCSDHERNVLLDVVAKLCAENNWPPYVALVRKKDLDPNGLPIVGDGFFKTMKKLGYTFEDTEHGKMEFFKSCRGRCFTEPIPSGKEVARVLIGK